MEQNREIRVTGKGQLRIKPDCIRITLELTGTEKEYGEAVCRSAEETNRLKDLFENFGFKREELKTLRFDVDTEYENYQEKGIYKRRLTGYTFRHRIRVEFDSDNEKLGKILYALAHCPLRPQFDISYTVKDPEASKNRLLAKAVQDAAAKASVLSEAAGVTLGKLIRMDYSWEELELELQTSGRMLMADCCVDSAASCTPDIEPDDIEASDTVTVVWSIV